MSVTLDSMTLEFDDETEIIPDSQRPGSARNTQGSTVKPMNKANNNRLNNNNNNNRPNNKIGTPKARNNKTGNVRGGNNRDGNQNSIDDRGSDNGDSNNGSDENDNSHDSNMGDDAGPNVIKQTISSLVEKYGQDVVLEQSEEAIAGKKRKRVYKSKSANYNDVVRLRLKDLELSCRVSFFLNMNNSQASYLYEYFMSEFDGPRDAKNWLTDTAKLRINQNLNTWKFRTIDNLVTHVRLLNKEDSEFKRTKHKLVATSILEKKFNLESFVSIFDFVKGSIDLKSSGAIVHRYCKLLYVELVSYAKMHTVWLDDPKRLDASEYSRKGLANRLVTCTTSARWAKYIPTKEDIKFVVQTRPYKKSKKRTDQFKAPDDDAEFYVLDESDGDARDRDNEEDSDNMARNDDNDDYIDM